MIFAASWGLPAWNTARASVSPWEMMSARTAVYFPQTGQLEIRAGTDSERHRPGETAHLNIAATTLDGEAAESAFGLAIVDQAVLERARTDAETRAAAALEKLVQLHLLPVGFGEAIRRVQFTRRGRSARG